MVPFPYMYLVLSLYIIVAKIDHYQFSGEFNVIKNPETIRRTHSRTSLMFSNKIRVVFYINFIEYLIRRYQYFSNSDRLWTPLSLGILKFCIFLIVFLF